MDTFLISLSAWKKLCRMHFRVPVIVVLEAGRNYESLKSSLIQQSIPPLQAFSRNFPSEEQARRRGSA